jgi:dTDP-L-rhamnose 4-epimerase
VKALVTGGAGFIGSHIAEALLSRGVDVVVLDSLEPRVHGRNPAAPLPDGAEFIRGDVRQKSAWEAALQGVDYVFHEAAYQDYMPDYSRFFHANVVGTALMYEVISEQRLTIRKVVVASSQAVYGEGQYDCEEHGLMLPPARAREQMMLADWEARCPACGREMKPRLLREAHPNPYNPYALSKYAQEMAAIRLGRRTGVPTVALRYSIVQGPRQSPFNTYSGICRIFALRLLNGQPPIIYEDGDQQRDYCHIDDVVAANLLVAQDDRADFEAFNVGSGRGTTVREYAAQMGHATGRELAPVTPGKFRVGDSRHSVSSVAKLGALGWRPKRGLEEIMRDYWEWLQSSGMGARFDTSADADMERNGVVCAAAIN